MQACLREGIFLFLFIRRQPNMRMERSGIRMSTAEACGGDSKAGETIDAVVDIKIKLLRENLWQNLGEGTDGEDKGCALKDAREIRRYIICQFSVI